MTSVTCSESVIVGFVLYKKEGVVKMIAVYLLAIVAANLIVTQFGPWASVGTAFLFIGLVITTRDYLHELWSNDGLKWKMAVLIATGGLISYILNADSGRIALASFIAFSISETVDALLYHKLREHGWYVKVNGSNVASAGLDSVIFPTLAFGTFMPLIILGQFIVKVLGGALWSMLIRPRTTVVILLLALPTVANAQIVAFGGGTVTSDAGTQVVIEQYIAAPAYTKLGIRPYGIISVPVGDVGNPTFVSAVDASIASGKWGWTSAGPGIVWLPFLDYRPQFMLSSTTGFKLHWPGWSAVIIGSTRMESRAWSVVVKLNYTTVFGG